MQEFWKKPEQLSAPKPNDPATTPPVPTTIAPKTGDQASPGLDAFNYAIRFVMKNEDGMDWDHDNGEYTNNPKDPGGRTMWGIIQTEYEGFLGRKLSEDEIKAMPRETAVAIYRKNFWEPIHGDSYINQAIVTAIMDTCVNKGLGGCMVILTDALNNHFPVRYGSDLIAAANALDAPTFMNKFEPAVERYIARRIADYPNMEWARKGWMNRSKRLYTLVGQP